MTIFAISSNKARQLTATPMLVSNQTEVSRRIKALRNRPSPGSIRSESVSINALEDQIFEALAAVKILMSQVAMHLDREWRSKLFSQLDSLHDPAEWEQGDQPVRQDSFSTFLKAILHISPARRPGLGLSHAGNLVATWTNARDRLTIEFMPEDRVRWVLSRYDDDKQPERFAGEIGVSRLSESLSSYKPDHWFANVKNQAPT